MMVVTFPNQFCAKMFISKGKEHFHLFILFIKIIFVTIYGPTFNHFTTVLVLFHRISDSFFASSDAQGIMLPLQQNIRAFICGTPKNLLKFFHFFYCRNVTITAGSIISFNVSVVKSFIKMLRCIYSRFVVQSHN